MESPIERAANKTVEWVNMKKMQIADLCIALSPKWWEI